MQNIKTLIVNEILSEFKEVKSGVFINYQGLSTEEINNLRSSLRKQNIQMSVYKNTLFRIALKELDLGIEVDPSMKQSPFGLPMAVLYSPQFPEPVEAAKALSEWQKSSPQNKVQIKGGFYGNRLISSEEVKQYINLPTRDALIAQVVGGIAAPLTSFVGVLSAVMRDFVLVLKGIKDKKEKE